MTGLLILLAIGLALAYAFSVWMIMHRMRHPPRRSYATAVARNMPGDPSEADPPRSFRAFEFDRSGRRLSVWEIEGERPNGPIIIASPGWGDSKVSITTRLRALAPMARTVFAWDPSGLGESPGKCALGAPRDIDDLVELATEMSRGDLSADPAPIVLFGWSLGAGMSIAAGAVLESRGAPLVGVIAESPYRLAPTPSANYIRLLGLPYRANNPVAFWLMGLRQGVGPVWKGFDRAEHAAQLHAPLLMLHGDQDQISPVDDGRVIAQAAPSGRLVLIEGAGHNNLWTEERLAAECERAVRAWAEEAMKRRSDEETEG